MNDSASTHPGRLTKLHLQPLPVLLLIGYAVLLSLTLIEPTFSRWILWAGMAALAAEIIVMVASMRSFSLIGLLLLIVLFLPVFVLPHLQADAWRILNAALLYFICAKQTSRSDPPLAKRWAGWLSILTVGLLLSCSIRAFIDHPAASANPWLTLWLGGWLSARTISLTISLGRQRPLSPAFQSAVADQFRRGTILLQGLLAASLFSQTTALIAFAIAWVLFPLSGLSDWLRRRNRNR